MFAWIGLISIWCVGAMDYMLSRQLIERIGTRCEMNALARWMVEHWGPEALLYYKLAALVVFTGICLLARRRNRPLIDRAVGMGIVVYHGLALWWCRLLFDSEAHRVL